MLNTDLTKFNLNEANYKVSLLTLSYEDYDSDNWHVAIYNDNENITFYLPNVLSYDQACYMVKKIESLGVVNLILWNPLSEHIYYYKSFEECMKDVINQQESEQESEQEAEFINEFILAGGDQFDAKTIWNQRTYC